MKLIFKFVIATIFLLCPATVSYAWMSDVNGVLCWNGDVNFPILRSFKFEGDSGSNPGDMFVVVDLNSVHRNGNTIDVMIYGVEYENQRDKGQKYTFQSNTLNPNDKNAKFWESGYKKWVTMNEYTVLPWQYEVYQHAAHRLNPSIPIKYLPLRKNSIGDRFYKNNPRSNTQTNTNTSAFKSDKISDDDLTIGGIRLGMTKGEVDAKYGRGRTKPGAPVYFLFIYGNGSLEVMYYTNNRKWREKDYIVIGVTVSEANGLKTGNARLSVGEPKSAMDRLNATYSGPYTEVKHKVHWGQLVNVGEEPWKRYDFFSTDRSKKLRVYVDDDTNKIIKIESKWEHNYLGY
ncbi:MAG: hypothetical protein IKN43_03240 [Selenomonadaceae bacterium]|nr:hypothetical protein [Selenomonadaceae bacterium]